MNTPLMPSFAKTIGLIVAILCVAGANWSAGSRVVTLHHFNGSDGTSPDGPMLMDVAGNLYGETIYGGKAGFGVIFELSPPANGLGKWTERVLHSFAGGTDGIEPSRGLTFDRAGNIYGTTFGGGNCPDACGIVFELSPPARHGGAWTETVLHRFRGPNFGDGGAPDGNLIFDGSGNLFGTASFGGLSPCTISPGPCGVAFELSPSSPGNPWNETVLYTFTGVPDGAFPAGGLAVDLNGNLYGTTEQGGSGKCTDGEGLTIGCGTAYELSMTGGAWKESIIYDFHPAESQPRSDMVFDGRGRLYGTVDYDVFRLQPPATGGGLWKQRLLYRFPEGISGSITGSDLIFDRAGNLYGTTSASGLTGFGTVYELSPPVTDLFSWTLTTFQTYTGGFDAMMPFGGVLIGTGGTLYGATAKMDESDPGDAIKIVP